MKQDRARIQDLLDVESGDPQDGEAPVFNEDTGRFEYVAALADPVTRPGDQALDGIHGWLSQSPATTAATCSR